ncbi:hypothetical protein [Streptomyces sp. DH10]|uniref:hypothetical protein n=1 Tax=Streptomyces sp. DH10 TaxID=3040121 RepID=UPI002441B45B|nr:hypothetical protein [Streptomyces sp. DH10]MDG9713609.1 hypothetical protein [Streptomyces sp. DH10]
MTRGPHHAAARQAAEGFTATVCRAEGGCGAADSRVLEALRDATRRVPFGLLVATGITTARERRAPEDSC